LRHRADKRTDRQTDTKTNVSENVTPATAIGVSDNILTRKMNLKN